MNICLTKIPFKGIINNRIFKVISEIEISLADKKIAYGKRKVRFGMPEPARKALMNGLWDSTNMLLANKDRIVKTAQNLPYIRGFDRV